MNPCEVVKMIQMNCKETASQEKKNMSVDEVIQALKSPQKSSTRKALKFIIKKSRRAVAIREQTKSETIRFTDKLRQAFRLLSKKMVLAGVIPNEDLIFHLSHFELGKIIEGLSNNQRYPSLISK